MKFKASLQDPKTLLGVLQMCRSIQRDCCIVRLHSEKTRFFTKVNGVDGVQVWVGCRTASLFSDFRSDSSYHEQSITCEILDMQQFAHIIKQAADVWQGGRGPKTVVRLARTGSRPALKVSIQGCHGHVDISCDVPIRVLGDAEIERMQAPPLEDDRVHVAIPNLPELTTFIDKLKSTSCERVNISAKGYPYTSLSGSKRSRGSRGDGRPSVATLTIFGEHFLGSFCLKYDAVELIDTTSFNDEDDEGNGGAAVPDDERAATVSVEVRTFARFFSAVKEVNPTRVSMYLVDGRAMVLSVYAGTTTMVAYIPAKSD